MQTDYGAQDLAEPSLMSRSKQHAKTSRRLPKDAFKYHESLKTQNTYREFYKAEQSSFCPLSFGCTGGAAPAATPTMQGIAEKLSEKMHESYSETLNYIRTKISFALLRSAIFCIRRCRSMLKTQFLNNSISATIDEGWLT